MREGGRRKGGEGEGGMNYTYRVYICGGGPTVRVWISFCPIDPFPYAYRPL